MFESFGAAVGVESDEGKCGAEDEGDGVDKSEEERACGEDGSDPGIGERDGNGATDFFGAGVGGLKLSDVFGGECEGRAVGERGGVGDGRGWSGWSRHNVKKRKS